VAQWHSIWQHWIKFYSPTAFFSDKNAQKIVFVFGQGCAPDPAGWAPTLPNLLVHWERNTSSTFPFSPFCLPAFSVSVSGPVFFKYDHLAKPIGISVFEKGFITRRDCWKSHWSRIAGLWKFTVATISPALRICYVSIHLTGRHQSYFNYGLF